MLGLAKRLSHLTPRLQYPIHRLPLIRRLNSFPHRCYRLRLNRLLNAVLDHDNHLFALFFNRFFVFEAPCFRLKAFFLCFIFVDLEYKAVRGREYFPGL